MIKHKYVPEPIFNKVFRKVRELDAFHPMKSVQIMIVPSIKELLANFFITRTGNKYNTYSINGRHQYTTKIAGPGSIFRYEGPENNSEIEAFFGKLHTVIYHSCKDRIVFDKTPILA